MKHCIIINDFNLAVNTYLDIVITSDSADLD